MRITKVTDPFGRAASFEYNANGTPLLQSITDVIGIKSEMSYGNGSFVSSVKTPYGTSNFSGGVGRDQQGHPIHQWVEATDPVGGKERMELVHEWVASPEIPASEPAAVVPTGFATENIGLSSKNSFYWDKRATALHPNDRTKAHVTHWATTEQYKFGPGISSEKAPLENRVWYAYESGSAPSARVGGQVSHAVEGRTSAGRRNVADPPVRVERTSPC